MINKNQDKKTSFTIVPNRKNKKLQEEELKDYNVKRKHENVNNNKQHRL